MAFRYIPILLTAAGVAASAVPRGPVYFSVERQHISALQVAPNLLTSTLAGAVVQPPPIVPQRFDFVTQKRQNPHFQAPNLLLSTLEPQQIASAYPEFLEPQHRKRPVWDTSRGFLPTLFPAAQVAPFEPFDFASASRNRQVFAAGSAQTPQALLDALLAAPFKPLDASSWVARKPFTSVEILQNLQVLTLSARPAANETAFAVYRKQQAAEISAQNLLLTLYAPASTPFAVQDLGQAPRLPRVYSVDAFGSQRVLEVAPVAAPFIPALPEFQFPKRSYGTTDGYIPPVMALLTPTEPAEQVQAPQRRAAYSQTSWDASKLLLSERIPSPFAGATPTGRRAALQADSYASPTLLLDALAVAAPVRSEFFFPAIARPWHVDTLRQGTDIFKLLELVRPFVAPPFERPAHKSPVFDTNVGSEVLYFQEVFPPFLPVDPGRVIRKAPVVFELPPNTLQQLVDLPAQPPILGFDFSPPPAIFAFFQPQLPLTFFIPATPPTVIPGYGTGRRIVIYADDRTTIIPAATRRIVIEARGLDDLTS